MNLSDYLSYLVVGLVSFTFGAITQFGYLKMKGRKVVIPFIEHTSRNMTILAISLAAISLFTIVSVETTAKQYRDCQSQFQAALKYNTSIAADVRDLTVQKDTIEKSSRANIVNFVVAVSAAGASPEARRAAFEEFVDTSTRLNDQLDRTEADRANLEANREPYPEPKCGLK